MRSWVRMFTCWTGPGSAIDCPRKQSGNTRAVPGAKRAFPLGTTCVTWPAMHGSEKPTRKVHTRWLGKWPIPGDSSTCTETSGNGAGTGTIHPITTRRRRLIPEARRREITGSIEAAVLTIQPPAWIRPTGHSKAPTVRYGGHRVPSREDFGRACGQVTPSRLVQPPARSSRAVGWLHLVDRASRHR